MFRTGFVGRQFPSGLGAGSVTGASPSLNLDFTSGALDSRITFTRASTATYFDSTGTMQSAATNTPRFDYDPASLQMRGLLIEEARTNSFVQSGDFNNAAWTKVNSTLSAGVSAPDGTTNARGIISNAGVVGYCSVSFTPVAGTAYTVSCFLKAGSLTQVILLLPGTWWADAVTRTAQFILSGNGSIQSTTGGGASATIQPCSNGWYRCAITATPDTAAAGGVQMARATANGDGATVQHYAWGAQLEAGAFATSYIPTAAAAATRQSDNANMIIGGASWFNPNAGTLYAEYDTERTGPPNMVSGGFSDGTFANTVYFTQNTWTGIIGGVGATATSGAVNWNGPINKQIGNWNRTAGVTTSMNAAAASTSSPLTGSPAWGTNLAIGSAPWSVGSNSINGHMRVMRYWPRALDAGELLVQTSTPTLDIDLRAPTLDPRITFARASSGSFFNSAGVLTTVGSNVARLDYDKDTLQPRGLLIEEARTNGIRNSVAAGIVPGIGGAGGAGPTNWTFGSAAVYTITYSSPGVFNGIQCVDVRYQGTSSGTFIVIGFEPTTQIVAAPGDVWAESFYAALVGGSWQGTTAFNINTRFTGANVPTFVVPFPTSTLTRYSAVGTASAGATNIQPAILISTQVGVPIDFTLRLGAPQCELGAYVTSYIPTSGAAATRSLESASMLAGPWFNPSAFSLAGDFLIAQVPNPSTTLNREAASLSDNTINNRASLRAEGVGANASNGMLLTSVGGTSSSLVVFTPNAGVTNKIAAAYTSGAQAASGNGGTVVTGSATGIPAVTQLNFGNGFTGAGIYLNGYVQRVRVWSRQLSNAELQAVTR